MRESVTYKIADLGKVAGGLIDFLKSESENRGADQAAVVVGLHGNLGAGKTTLAKEVGRQLGVEEVMTSPTFVIQKNYATRDETFERFAHIDAYRLEESRELAVLGFQKLVGTLKTLIFIEWPEKVADILPDSTIHIYISSADEETRLMKFHDQTN